jgi:hypothetical protein
LLSDTVLPLLIVSTVLTVSSGLRGSQI